MALYGVEACEALKEVRPGREMIRRIKEDYC